MGIIVYFSVTAFLIVCVLAFGNRMRNLAFGFLFITLQWAFTIYEYCNLNIIQLEYFTPDSIGILLLFVLAILTTTSYYYNYLYFKDRQDSSRNTNYYVAAFIVLIMSLSCANLANHIAIQWIFVEFTTLSSCVLIYHNRNEKSLEATWKYLFIGSVSVALIFIGILFLGLSVQGIKVPGLFYSDLIKNAASLNDFWLKSSFLLVFTGFTVKAGLAPMYTAGIDAKDKAPSPASAIFSSAMMNVGFLGIFRLYEVVSHTPAFDWAKMVMIVSAAISIFISATYMARVKNYKRMFAYSSIEHMGIIMLGLASGGVGYFGALLHLVLHSFAKSSLFYQCASIFRIFGSKHIKDSGNYFSFNLSGSLVIILGFFIITAIPPSGMFVSEFMIFRSLFDAGYLWLLIIVVILLAFIIWSMGESLLKLLFDKSAILPVTNSTVKKAIAESVPQFILLLGVIYLGFFPPEFLTNLINSALINFK
jgi:hydrogenase-4 component F